MKDILITENITGPASTSCGSSSRSLSSRNSGESSRRLQEMAAGFQAIIVRNQTKVTADLIQVAPALKVIGRAGAGLDNIDLLAADRAGVVVAYTPEQNSVSVAELTLGLMLSLARKIPAADRSTRAGKWERFAFMGSELYGKTLGIVGLGRIGYRTAVRARAFGMDIIAHDEYANPDAIFVSETRARMTGLEELLAEADYVSCHLPLTRQTMNFFNYQKFSSMKASAFFINASRGEVVDEDGLVRALQEGKLAGAALDVRQKEPPAQGPLSQMENVIITPHIGAFTEEGQNRVVASVCRDVASILSGREAKNFFNFSRPNK